MAMTALKQFGGIALTNAVIRLVHLECSKNTHRLTE